MVIERRSPNRRREVVRGSLSVVEREKGLMWYLIEWKGDTVTDVGGSRERRWTITVIDQWM